MSEVVGSASVIVYPDTRQFSGILNKEVSQATTQASATAARSSTGARAELRAMAADVGRMRAESQRLADTTKTITARQNEVARSSIGAGRGLGAFTAAAFIGYQATQQLASALEVTGYRAGETGGQLRNLGASLLRGDIIGGMKALATQSTLSAAALESVVEAANSGNTDQLVAFAKAAQSIGSTQAVAQIQAAQAQARTSRTADASTAASITPGLQDDLSAAKRAEREAQIGLRIFQQGTAEYSKAFAGYADAIAARRAVEAAIEKESGGLAQDASRQSNFQLSATRAAQTKTLSDDRAVFSEREKFLKGQIGYLEQAGANTAAAKDRLQSLYGQLDNVEGQLATLDEQAAAARQARLQARLSLDQTTLQIQAANARTDSEERGAIEADAAFARKNAQNKNLDAQTRAGYQLQAAQDDKQVYDLQQAAAAEAARAAEEAQRAADAKKKQLAEERRQAAERLAQQRATARSTEELRLQNSIAAASLTKGTADDKKAINANIAYWRNIVRTTRGLQREQARATVIGLRGQLQGTNSASSEAPRSSASDFFNEAASQYRTQGSNISTAGGILSGQDARGAFAARALSSKNLGSTQAQQAQQTRNASLAEAQKQTVILKTIATRLTYGGAQGDPPAKAIANARRGAHTVASAV